MHHAAIETVPQARPAALIFNQYPYPFTYPTDYYKNIMAKKKAAPKKAPKKKTTKKAPAVKADKPLKKPRGFTDLKLTVRHDEKTGTYRAVLQDKVSRIVFSSDPMSSEGHAQNFAVRLRAWLKKPSLLPGSIEVPKA